MPKNKKCQFKFKSVLKELTCSKPAFEGSDYCILHKPKKTEEETKLFEKQIKKKLENKDYHFIGYHFPRGMSFEGQVFEKAADFEESTFEGYASFRKSIFQETATFRRPTFQGVANFEKSTFEGHIDT